MGIVKGVINTVKNIGSNVGNPPKKKRGKFKKHTPRPARGSVRGGGRLR